MSIAIDDMERNLMTDILIKRGNKTEAISIMREAAQWQIQMGTPLWQLTYLTDDNLNNPDDEFIILYKEGISISTMILSSGKDFIWPCEDNTSMFIHKLAVKREYAGEGYAQCLIKYAIVECRKNGYKYLRLDSDPHRKSLCDFYRNSGFDYVKTITLNTPRLGDIDCALFEIKV